MKRFVRKHRPFYVHANTPGLKKHHAAWCGSTSMRVASTSDSPVINCPKCLARAAKVART